MSMARTILIVDDDDDLRESLKDQLALHDEFQVTTAELVGEEHYLFYNRLKFFHSAGSTTPTGRWILSERFRSTRILREHLDG